MRAFAKPKFSKLLEYRLVIPGGIGKKGLTNSDWSTMGAMTYLGLPMLS